MGCLNPSGELDDAAANIRFAESRLRVIALIEDLRGYLGRSFPEHNNRRIPNARIIIKGEPD